MSTFYLIFAAFFGYWLGKKRGKVITVYNKAGGSLRRREEFRDGQIVFVSCPGKKDFTAQNMITQILSIDKKHGSALIRTRGNILRGSTTSGVLLEHLTALPLDENFPLQFPGKPVPSYNSPNQAVWNQVPLDWFTYIVRPPKEEKVS